MPAVKYARQMLTMAKKDLKAIQAMKNSELFDDEVFGFHAEQAIEKAFKSWLNLIDVEYPKVHDLEKLVMLLEEQGERVPESFKKLIDWSDFAVQFRYEELYTGSVIFDREEVCNEVDALVSYVDARISNTSQE